MSISITQFNHLRIPLEEILEATNNFSEENIIGKGDFGYIYEGQFLHYGEIINISAKRLDRSQGLGDMEFLTEVSVLSGLRHPNIVSLFGFCDEKGEKIIINRHEAKGSLSMYLDDPTLTWEQRLRISIGVAKAICYIHYGEGHNYSIIHRNINSSTILLDDNFEAKLSGFEFSIKDSVDRMERYISSEVIGTQGYMAPETIKSGDVTQKSDVYSFGVVLWEIVCGRKAFLPNEEVTNMFLAPLARSHLQNDTLQDITNSDIVNQGTQKSVKAFLTVASSSISEDGDDRPDGKMLFFILYGALIQQLPSLNPESSLDVEKDENDALLLPSKDELGVVVESTPANAWKVNKLEHLRIGLIDILKATDNFSDEYKLSDESEVWNMMDVLHVYTGDLELYDRKYVSSLEGKNIGELPKRHYNVRIMCFQHATAVDRFYNAIEILSTCKHENIDSLLGFCHEGSHRILVYEGDTYILLSLWLHSASLTWDVRLKICLDVAQGLNYLHNEMEDQKMVIHRDISSMCILLDDQLQGAKITGFEQSTFRENQDDLVTNHLKTWSLLSMAPEFSETGKATKESDIYRFGLVMFELLCGVSYLLLRMGNEFRAEQWFKDGKIKQRVARFLREENRGNKLFLKEGPNEDSLDTFIKITEQCLAVNPEQRPTLQVIIRELRKALTFQKKHKNRLRIPFRDIRSATQNFSRANDIGGGGFGRVYKGQLASKHGSTTIVAKRLDTRLGQGDQQFYNELHILSEYKHKNVIRLVGYNNYKQERIIVYEYASKGSLNNYLNDASLTWINRLNICIDVARGLAFLHGGVREHEAVIHRDMKTANILLFDDWKAKVADFGLSLICTINAETDYVIDYACGTPGYLDPRYQKSRILTKESDIYSFGIILLEILFGRSTYEVYKHEGQFLHTLVNQRFEEGRLDEVVFNAIKNQIVQQSLVTFLEVAYQCLCDDRVKRPSAKHVLKQLRKALKLQVKDVPVCQES